MIADAEGEPNKYNFFIEMNIIGNPEYKNIKRIDTINDITKD